MQPIKAYVLAVPDGRLAVIALFLTREDAQEYADNCAKTICGIPGSTYCVVEVTGQLNNK